jgi:ATP synthase protein I
MHTYDAAVLRGAGVPAVGASAVVVAGAAGVSGGSAALGAALGAALVLAVFGLTAWLCSFTRGTSPVTAMTVALSSYVGKVVALGGVLALSGSSGPLASDAFPLALVVVTLAWMVGEVRAFATLRTPYVEPVGWATPAPSPSRRPAVHRAAS